MSILLIAVLDIGVLRLSRGFLARSFEEGLKKFGQIPPFRIIASMSYQYTLVTLESSWGRLPIDL
jgi:hypothetical protein